MRHSTTCRTLPLVALLLPIALPAQTAFAPVGARWTYTQGSCCGPDSTVAVIEVLSDTVIGGRTCSRLTASSGWFGCYGIVRYLTVSNDSMYYFNEDDPRFQLLFRWNAEPGSTWETPISQGAFTDTLDWTVSDTGHVVIGGVPLRTLTIGQDSRQGVLYCPLDGLITEQLGGAAPFTWAFAACDGETYNGLRCYDQNIFPLPEPPPPPPISWLNPQFPQCDLSVGIDARSSGERFSARPTLASTNESIRVTSASGILDVFDGRGQLVSRHRTNGSTSISMGSSGAYVLRFTTANGEVAHQRVVVH